MPIWPQSWRESSEQKHFTLFRVSWAERLAGRGRPALLLIFWQSFVITTRVNKTLSSARAAISSPMASAVRLPRSVSLSVAYVAKAAPPQNYVTHDQALQKERS